MSRAYLELCFHRKRDELLSFLKRRVGCEQVAADLLHDTYLRLQRYPDASAVANANGFVFRIAANLALDYRRRLAVRERHEASVADPAMLPEYPCLPSPEQQAADAERLHALADLLAQLPSACQAVFVLNRIEGYTQAEIAQQLGISTSMVAKHLARALKWCHAHVRNP